MAGELVELRSNGVTTQGYLAVPEETGPGIIVIQEWWGLVPHIKEVCDRFAAEGFVALAPDFFHGKTTTSPDEAGRLMMALNIDEAAKDLKAAVTFLLSQNATANKRKVGIVGFCMGGQLALYAACQSREIGACVDYYGIHPSVKPNLSALRAPVLGFFGEKDEFVSPEAANKLKAELDKHDKPADFTIFPNVGHAFFNDSRPEVYHEPTAQQTWERMNAFFREHLR